MAIVNNDLLVRSLVGLVGKGTIALDPAARPGITMGGRPFALSSVSFDNATGSFIFRIRDGRDKEISSSLGIRDIRSLSADILGSLVGLASKAREARVMKASASNDKSAKNTSVRRISV